MLRKGRRKLDNIEDYLDTSIWELEDYIKMNIGQQWLGNRNDKENNCMDISSDKLTKCHTRRPGHGNFKREIKSLVKTAENNVIKTSYVKVKINKTQQNSKCMLCVDIDKTISYTINQSSKLVQKKYKTRHDWVGRVTRWELCKKLKFNQLYARTKICLGEWDT